MIISLEVSELYNDTAGFDEAYSGVSLRWRLTIARLPLIL